MRHFSFFSNDQRGVAIIITLVILGIMLAIGVGVASVFTREIQISGGVDDSVSAALAADAGTERALYMVRKGGGRGDDTYTSPSLANGASYEVCGDNADCDHPNPIRIVSVGSFRNTKRSFEVCYDDQGNDDCAEEDD
jgi:Tfp pilus assembly protein PilX